MDKIKKILDILKKFKCIFSDKQKKICKWMFVMLFIGSFLEMIGVSAIIPLVQVILSPEEMLHEGIYGKITDFFSITDAKQLVLAVTITVILVYLFKNIYMATLAYIKSKVLRRFERELSLRLMKSYLNRSYIFHVEHNSSILVKSVNSDTAVTVGMLLNISNIIIESMSIFLIGVFLFLTDSTIAITVMCLAAFSFALVTAIFKGTLSKQGKKGMIYRGVCYQYITQAFNGIKDILLKKKQQFFLDSYERAMVENNRAASLYSFSGECPAYIIEAICISGFVILLGAKSLYGDVDSAFISQAAAFAVAAFRILPSVGKISNNFAGIIYNNPALDDIYKNIHEVEQYEEQSVDEQSNKGINDNATIKDWKNILIDQVTWKYPSAQTSVINALSLKIDKGTAIGLIGPSGAGKTTLADMILGLLPPLYGHIYVDQYDIHDIPVQWSRMIGYVPQSIYLTDDTIRNNVAFGINTEEIYDEIVWDTLEKAQLADFVRALPEGIDTIVGERGIKFSGGQRQRIAIARALYENPDILVLDEATSALDNETEEAVMDAIEKLHGHKTLIIVAHRLSTIEKCDKIYRIENGKAELANL